MRHPAAFLFRILVLLSLLPLLRPYHSLPLSLLTFPLYGIHLRKQLFQEVFLLGFAGSLLYLKKFSHRNLPSGFRSLLFAGIFRFFFPFFLACLLYFICFIVLIIFSFIFCSFLLFF